MALQFHSHAGLVINCALSAIAARSVATAVFGLTVHAADISTAVVQVTGIDTNILMILIAVGGGPGSFSAS